MSTYVAQLQFESDKWKRLIEFMQLENAYCKNRLSDIVRNGDVRDSSFLDQAEFYQNYYIQQDTILSMLRTDVYEFEKLLEKEKFFDGELIKKVQSHQKKIRHEMDKLGLEFQRGNKLFNDFLEANS